MGKTGFVSSRSLKDNSICKRKPRVLRLNVVFGLLAASILLLTATAEGRQDGRSVETPASNTFLQSLTGIERAWLRDHPVIRVVQAPDWPPVEFTDERGEPSGMAGDYLNLIEQRLGVKFERVRNLSWQEAYARLKRWEIDMTTSVAVTALKSIPVVVLTTSIGEREMMESYNLGAWGQLLHRQASGF